MTKKEQSTGDVLTGFAEALAKAQGHPDPAGFAADVKRNFEYPEGLPAEPEAKPIDETAAEAIAEVKAEGAA